eukprot:SAG11_NODE_4278_length_1970_cov_3.899519_2_plen_283_part_01
MKWCSSHTLSRGDGAVATSAADFTNTADLIGIHCARIKGETNVGCRLRAILAGIKVCVAACESICLTTICSSKKDRRYPPPPPPPVQPQVQGGSKHTTSQRFALLHLTNHPSLARPGQWLPSAACGGDGGGGRRRNPAAALRGRHRGKLLCAMYAWDGNAYPVRGWRLSRFCRAVLVAVRTRLSDLHPAGHHVERFRANRPLPELLRSAMAANSLCRPAQPYGMLSASGDPAAACCSTVSELANPAVNPRRVCGAATLLYPTAASSAASAAGPPTPLPAAAAV